ncbi:hypothetical protein XENOCAPTIV_014392, partial [Xenoophorus captivus]
SSLRSREEDFYYTKICCETIEASSAPSPAQQSPSQPSSALLSWASCGSPPGSELQIPVTHRPRSNSSSLPGPSRSCPLSQSAPSSFWQIHTEHLYQVGAAVLPQYLQGERFPLHIALHVQPLFSLYLWSPEARAVRVGPPLPRYLPTATLRWVFCLKGRGEAKKCRKVYGVERKDQWCTACRWKKACQRFPD